VPFSDGCYEWTLQFHENFSGLAVGVCTMPSDLGVPIWRGARARSAWYMRSTGELCCISPTHRFENTVKDTECSISASNASVTLQLDLHRGSLRFSYTGGREIGCVEGVEGVEVYPFVCLDNISSAVTITSTKCLSTALSGPMKSTSLVDLNAAATGGAREWPIELDTLLVQLAVERASVLKSSVLYMDPAKLFDKTDQFFHATPDPQSVLPVVATDSEPTQPLSHSDTDTLGSSASEAAAEREEQLLTRQVSRRPLLTPAREAATPSSTAASPDLAVDSAAAEPKRIDPVLSTPALGQVRLRDRSPSALRGRLALLQRWNALVGPTLPLIDLRAVQDPRRLAHRLCVAKGRLFPETKARLFRLGCALTADVSGHVPRITIKVGLDPPNERAAAETVFSQVVPRMGKLLAVQEHEQGIEARHWRVDLGGVGGRTLSRLACLLLISRLWIRVVLIASALCRLFRTLFCDS
jgi:hypothetical protein